MMTESAVVIDYESGIATVKCQSQSACGSCSAKTACGTSALAKLTGEKGEHIFRVPTIMPLKVGQMVEIGLSERSLLLSALLLYVVPLITLLVATLISERLFNHELIRAVFILLTTALSFFIVRFYTNTLNKKPAYQPILLRVL
ncbi:MAG TPA: hypothetical protein DD638_12605 [Pasteurellaceae bacterium]|nr:hypothetical protein [Pasteurellaceae bacterium]